MKVVPLNRAKREMIAKLEQLIARVDADEIFTFAYVLEGKDADGDVTTGHGWQVSDETHMTTVLGAVELLKHELAAAIVDDARS